MTRLVNMIWSLREGGESLACAPPVFNCMSKIPPPLAPKKEVITPCDESAPESDDAADELPGAERNYGEVRLWLVARDPRSLFAYWEFRAEEHLHAAGSDGRAHFFLRIFRENGEAVSSTEIEPFPGNAFIPVQSPDSGYFCELGFYAGKTWCFIARSGVAHTPPEIPPEDAPVLFATIPAQISLAQMRRVLSASARPGESLAVTAARIQGDAREHGEWTPEHECLLAEILGVRASATGGSPASSITLTVRRKLAVTAKAAMPGMPVPAPQIESALASPGAGWSSAR